MASRKDRYLNLRLALREFVEKREHIKVLDKEVKAEQPNIISRMLEADPGNEGIVLDPDSPKGTAYVQQNEGSLVWDEEKIIDWLANPSRRQLKMKASSRVFDINKFEALVASKEISPKVAKRFQKRTDPPKPFIRMGKKGDESL